jgi:hypothetical protein
MDARVVSVASDDAHRFSKVTRSSIHLVAGLGVEGDAHCGATVRHRSRVAVDPSASNLRQVHLIRQELFADPATRRFAPGDLGENILTRGLDLLALPCGTRLAIGPTAVVELTGLRNPCAQIEHFRPGLLAAVLDRAPDGTRVRKAGVMAAVVASDPVTPGDAIVVTPARRAAAPARTGLIPNRRNSDPYRGGISEGTRIRFSPPTWGEGTLEHGPSTRSRLSKGRKFVRRC